MPLKRNEFLKPISREHHHGLLLCFKIRTGIKKQITAERINKYANWFYQNHLIPHLSIEEEILFPILGNENELVVKAIEEHRTIDRLFKNQESTIQNLNAIADAIENHIRFEERILFTALQDIATENQLQQIELHHTESKFIENTEDVFWV